ncbi:hypothetical protein FHG87_021680 [Trinorchestia longiramus]|nr:hypothetical protein FHG87_021680 [Trinorchestia longiramus]
MTNPPFAQLNVMVSLHVGHLCVGPRNVSITLAGRRMDPVAGSQVSLNHHTYDDRNAIGSPPIIGGIIQGRTLGAWSSSKPVGHLVISYSEGRLRAAALSQAINMKDIMISLPSCTHRWHEMGGKSEGLCDSCAASLRLLCV